MKQLQCGKIDKQPTAIIKEPFHNNWAELPDNITVNQLVENNWTGEVFQQIMTS